MTTIYRSTIVPFSPDQMFDLVNDIEQYPHFLPWCPQARILHQTDHEMQATIYLKKGVWQQSITTRNQLVKPSQIKMELLQGPFRYLEGIWEFQSLEEGCQVAFQLSFALDSQFMNFTLGPLLRQIASTLVDAFKARAYEIYNENVSCS